MKGKGLSKNLFLKSCIKLALFMGLFIFTAKAAFAGTGDSMPWDSGLDKLVANLTGKTALAVGTLALFASATALVFGGEMSEWVRKTLLLVVAISMLISGGSLIKILFNVSGALIG